MKENATRSVSLADATTDNLVRELAFRFGALSDKDRKAMGIRLADVSNDELCRAILG